MRARRKATLYLTGDASSGFYVGNWPGTLKIAVSRFKLSRHNIARSRIDVWFRVEGAGLIKGANWHGYQIGDNSQLCHCKQLKGSEPGDYPYPAGYKKDPTIL
jgi:hypothetical protein